MIRFSANSWFTALFVYYGGVVPKLALPAALYVVYTTICYEYCKAVKMQFAADEGLELLAGCATFMLIFRLNQCYSRLQNAQAYLVMAVGGLRGTVCCICSMARCSKKSDSLSEGERQAATMVKVHVCRLAIAFAVSLKYHMRATEMMNSCGHKVESEALRHALTDFVRIKMLLTGAEAELLEEYCCGMYEELDAEGKRTNISVDINRRRTEHELHGLSQILGSSAQAQHGASSVPLFIISLLRMVIREPLEQPWGCPERVLTLCEKYIDNLTLAYRGMNRMVAVPLPLPYLQLCKLLLTLFLAVFPWSADLSHGAWGNIVIPSILALAMLGFETVSDIMENPLGDDSADISLYEAIHELEVDIENIFNCSAADRCTMLRSWQELAAQLGLEGGGAKLSSPDIVQDEFRFSDFFEWVPLSKHTVEYVTMQSTDIATLHTSLICHGKADSREEGHSESDSSETSVLNGNRRVQDVYTVTRCVALRAPLPHLKEAVRQRKALERMGDGDVSFRQVLGDGGRTAHSGVSHRGAPRHAI